MYILRYICIHICLRYIYVVVYMIIQGVFAHQFLCVVRDFRAVAYDACIMQWCMRVFM